MKFSYKAVGPDGRVSEGQVDADAMNGALTQISGMGLKPITVKPIKKTAFQLNLLKGFH